MSNGWLAWWGVAIAGIILTVIGTWITIARWKEDESDDAS
jgi:hypothetical protein